jgi:hypothetical protein
MEGLVDFDDETVVLTVPDLRQEIDSGADEPVYPNGVLAAG